MEGANIPRLIWSNQKKKLQTGSIRVLGDTIKTTEQVAQREQEDGVEKTELLLDCCCFHTALAQLRPSCVQTLEIISLAISVLIQPNHVT